MTDRDGKEKTREGIEENISHIQYVKKDKPAGGRLAATFGLHASLTLSEETLDMCRNTCPEDVGFHIHVAEHSVDQYDTLKKLDCELLIDWKNMGYSDHGQLQFMLSMLMGKKWKYLADTGTWVTHQPRSNMNNAVGISQAESMLRMGIKVCLGNDGFSNAMWEEWKTATLHINFGIWTHDGWADMPLQQMAIYNNAALATQQFGGESIGKLVDRGKSRPDFC